MRIVMTCDDRRIDRRILTEAETLFDEGHEVIVLALAYGNAPKYEILNNIKIERVSPNDITFDIPFNIPCKKFFKKITFLRRLSGIFFKEKEYILYDSLDEYKNLNQWDKALLSRIMFYRPDVIHAHDLPQLESAVIASRLLNCKIVYDAHEIYPEINTLTNEQKKTLKEKEEGLVHCVDAFITVNSFIAKWFFKNYKIKKIFVISNSAKEKNTNYLVKNKNIHEFLKIPHDTKIVVFSGWISLTRNIGDVIRSMQYVREDIHLVLIGEILKSELSSINKLIGKLINRIHHIDYVIFDRLEEFMRSADVGIIPYMGKAGLNNYFSSANKFFDFMLMNIPVITTDLPFYKKNVEEKGLGIVRKIESPKDFANAIHEMFDEKLGGPERFRTRILENRHNYLWDTHDKKTLLDIYKNLFYVK